MNIAATPAANRQPCILVVDDDESIRELLAEVLTASGFMVIEAANGRKAIEQLRRQGADLVITDLVMPEQEGLETITRLSKEFPQVKVIAVSGHSGVYLRQAQLLGAFATVPKPFSIDALLRVVSSGLESGAKGRRALGQH